MIASIGSCACYSLGSHSEGNQEGSAKPSSGLLDQRGERTGLSPLKSAISYSVTGVELRGYISLSELDCDLAAANLDSRGSNVTP